MSSTTARPPARPRRAFTVLLIEDSAADARLICELLGESQDFTWRVEQVARLSEAYAHVEQGGIDAVLLDLGLPDTEGLDGIDRLCATFPELPVLVLTVQDDKAVAIEALQIRAQDYLVKGRVDAGMLSTSLRFAIERKRLEDELLQAHKMEAVGRLAGGIAHDFNNQLGVILGYAKLLLDDPSLSGKARRRLEQVRSAAERAARSTEQLVAFARRQVMLPQRMDLASVVAGFAEQARKLLGPNIAYREELREGTIVEVDPGRIQDVLVQLALNAREAMPRGGDFRVAVKIASDADEEAGGEGARWAELSASDTGVGMDAATRKRAFEPFFSTKDPAKGAGLGLATVAGVVAQSGGLVRVESEPGRGSTIRILLPLHEPAAQLPDAAPATAAGPGQRTVLVVDDEPGVRELLRELLEEEGFEVLVAARGAEAVRLARSHARPIDLLVSDVVMPGMSGPEVWKAVSQLHRDARVLFVSGYTEDQVLRRGVRAGSFGFLHKPFAVGPLLDRIRGLLEA